MTSLKQQIVRTARECGFDLVRITGADEFLGDRDAALKRLKDGHMDGLPWYTPARVERGTNPGQLLPGARSIICLGLSYLTAGRSPTSTGPTGGQGRVARYAWVKDYHRAMKRRMRDLVRTLSSDLALPVSARWYVDDGPMLDRAAAHRAGLGWFGKSTNILTPSHGSWVFLGQIITDLDLTADGGQADEPLKKTCGACVRCIDDCPTGAIVAPYVVDNQRCISYQTIENRGPIPRDFRPLMGDWVFGCDICQDVCPVNRKAETPAIPITAVEVSENGRTSAEFLDLIELLKMTAQEFLDRFKGTSIMRAKRAGMQRNACVALGNAGREEAVPALAQALDEGEPLVRGHAAWALGKIGTAAAKQALWQAQNQEADAWVLEEIAAALAG